MRSHPLLEGAGFAALYTLPFASAFLTPSLGDAYHHMQPVTTIAFAILLMILLLTATGVIGSVLIDRLPDRARRIAWILPIVLLSWMLCRIAVVVSLNRTELANWATVESRFVPSGVAILTVLLLLSCPRCFTLEIRITRLIYVVASFTMLIVVPEIVYQAFRTVPQDRTSFMRPTLEPVSGSQPRVIWILMDELSYDQVFDHRRPYLTLPHFDDLAKSSTNFSAMQPVGYLTELVLPSLMLGEPVHSIRKPYGGPVDYQIVGGDRWQRFDQYRTVFGDAQKLGWTTGIAGWYNPYCRMLPDVLDRCFWQYSSQSNERDISHLLSSNNSTLTNFVALLPFRQQMSFLPKTPDDAELHRRDYVALMDQAQNLVRDQRIRFVFLHLPVPHLPGIYDRQQHTLASHGNYFDNLLLADESLGTLLEDIRAMGSVRETTVILSSDHSWRVPMWQGTPGWTREEEHVTGGHFDQRPVLLVHLAGMGSGQTIGRPENALVLHSILEALLRNQLRTPKDLSTLAMKPVGKK